MSVSDVLAIHQRFLVEQQEIVVCTLLRFFNEAKETGVKKADLPKIAAYLRQLELKTDTVDCYLEVYSETEIADPPEEVLELSPEKFSDCEMEEISDDESVGAIEANF